MDQDARRPIADAVRVPTLDESVLIDLLDGDVRLAAEVLRDFEGTLEQGADEIDAAFRNQRTQDLVVASHKLKSSSRTVGAMRLGELCERLEESAGGPVPSVERMILAIMAEIGAVGRRLRATRK